MAPYTWELVQSLKAGHMVFTQPPMPIKCAEPQKAMYLSAYHWQRQGVLKDIKIDFFNAGGVLFGVKEYEIAQRLATLNDVAGRFPQNQDIQLQLVMGAVNAAYCFGAAQRWDDLTRWLAPLSEVAGRFPENPDIQLQLMKGAVNATNHFGAAQRWDEMAQWLATLNDVAGRFPQNQDIQLQLMMGAASAVQSASIPTSLRQKALALLADVSRHHPGDTRIQTIAQEFGMTAADQMTRALAALQSTSQWRRNRLPST